jgi:hypothetical protein
VQEIDEIRGGGCIPSDTAPHSQKLWEPNGVSRSGIARKAALFGLLL